MYTVQHNDDHKLQATVVLRHVWRRQLLRILLTREKRADDPAARAWAKYEYHCLRLSLADIEATEAMEQAGLEAADQPGPLVVSASNGHTVLQTGVNPRMHCCINCNLYWKLLLGIHK